MTSVRAALTCGFFPTKLGIIVHDFPHQLFNQLLADHAILTASKFRDGLGDRANHFIGFIGIALSDPPAGAGYSAKKSSIRSTIIQ